jgi:hypothetical protein
MPRSSPHNWPQEKIDAEFAEIAGHYEPRPNIPSAPNSTSHLGRMRWAVGAVAGLLAVTVATLAALALIPQGRKKVEHDARRDAGASNSIVTSQSASPSQSLSPSTSSPSQSPSVSSPSPMSSDYGSRATTLAVPTESMTPDSVGRRAVDVVNACGGSTIETSVGSIDFVVSAATLDDVYAKKGMMLDVSLSSSTIHPNRIDSFTVYGRGDLAGARGMRVGEDVDMAELEFKEGQHNEVQRGYAFPVGHLEEGRPAQLFAQVEYREAGARVVARAAWNVEVEGRTWKLTALGQQLQPVESGVKTFGQSRLCQ